MPVIREQTRPLGVVYTPPEVAGPMVRLALEPLIAGRTAEQILALRVCDPAAGDGAFLLAVVQLLAAAVVSAWENGDPAASANSEIEQPIAVATRDRAELEQLARRRVLECVVGLDVDAQALQIARARLDEWAFGVSAETRGDEGHRSDLPAGTRTPGHGLEVPAGTRTLRPVPAGTRTPGHVLEVPAATRTPGHVLDVPAGTRGGLRVGNALELDWPAVFPEVFARGGFDVVLANPPYVRQEMLASKSALAKFASYDGVADLYVYFIELAHRVLRPGGRYCVIVPNKWLTVSYGRALRGYLAEQGSIDGIVDFARAPLFSDADAFPCIVWGTRRVDGASGVGQRPATSRRAASGPQQQRSTHVRAARPDERTPVEEALRGPLIDHARERWQADPWHIDSHTDRALIDRLERTCARLGDLVTGKPSRGVVTGCNRAFVIDRATRDRILAAEPAAASLIRPFVKGRDVRSWLPAEVERWIVLVDRGTSLEGLPVVRAHLAQFREALEPRPATWQGPWQGRKPGNYQWFELQDPVVPLAKSHAPRLLYQDIQTSPACCLDQSGDLVPDTTVWILPTDDLFLLAVLNSPLYGWYARRRFPPALNGAVRPKHEYMRSLPIASPSTQLRRTIVDLVQRRISGEELDAPIAAAIAGAYELSAAEQRLIAAEQRGCRASGSRGASRARYRSS